MACESPFGTGDPPAESARVVVGGETGALLRLVVSTSFEQDQSSETGNVRFRLLEADTLAVAVPYDEQFPLGVHKRILVRLSNPDTVATEARLQVFLGSEKKYDQTAVLTDQELQFAWAYF